jgi:hypothetical protein
MRIFRLRHAGFLDDADDRGKRQTLYETQFTASRRSAGVLDLKARGMPAYKQLSVGWAGLNHSNSFGKMYWHFWNASFPAF